MSSLSNQQITFVFASQHSGALMIAWGHTNSSSKMQEHEQEHDVPTLQQSRYLRRSTTPERGQKARVSFLKAASSAVISFLPPSLSSAVFMAAHRNAFRRFCQREKGLWCRSR